MHIFRVVRAHTAASKPSDAYEHWQPPVLPSAPAEEQEALAEAYGDMGDAGVAVEDEIDKAKSKPQTRQPPNHKENLIMEILKKISRWGERMRQWMQEGFDPDEHERAKRHVEATLGPTGLNKEIEQLAFNPHGADAERARGMQDGFNRNIG